MEKYRKFSDEKNGINPFISAYKIKQRGLFLNILRIPLIILSVIKLPLFLACYLQFALIQLLRYIFIIKYIKRPLEIIFVKIYCFFLLILMGVYNYKTKTPKIISKSNKKTIILSSQSCIIDWLCLMYYYCPRFFIIVKNNDKNNFHEDLVVELSYFSILINALGVKCLTYVGENEKIEVQKSFGYVEFEKEIIQSTNFTPIVIFPENFKTTREASLQIRSNVMDTIYKYFLLDKIQVICHISIYKFNYFCPNNTTDRKGIKNLFEILSQFYNDVSYQSILINKNNFDLSLVDKSYVKTFKSDEFYFDSLIQENLTHPEFRNNRVSLTCLNGMEFLDFYEKTASNTEYTKN